MFTQPLYMHASSQAPSPGQLPFPTEPAPMALSRGLYLEGIVGMLAVLLVFGAAVALLTLGKRGLFSVYSFSLFLLSLLSLPSVGWVFLPATGLLALAAMLSWLSGKGSRAAIPTQG